MDQFLYCLAGRVLRLIPQSDIESYILDVWIILFFLFYYFLILKLKFKKKLLLERYGTSTSTFIKNNLKNYVKKYAAKAG